MPRAFSSGALSIWSNAVNLARPFVDWTLVIAAVRVVLPWSTWPMVPMLTCGLFRMNFSLAISLAPSGSRHSGDQGVADAVRHFRVLFELHREGSPALGPRAKVGGVTEHG